ncbi:hypothetical protein D3C74_221250 [compost metagenome]
MSLIEALSYDNMTYGIGETHFSILDTKGHEQKRYPLLEVRGEGIINSEEYSSYTFIFPDSTKAELGKHRKLTLFVRAYNKQRAILSQEKE